MDNFEENNDRYYFELELDQNELTLNSFNSPQEPNEHLRTYFQKDSSRTLIQSHNPYSKLAFIKRLKDNLICLGHLTEAIDTLNYLNYEDLVSSSSSSNSKKGGSHRLSKHSIGGMNVIARSSSSQEKSTRPLTNLEQVRTIIIVKYYKT
jgi:hypothetical protein